MTDNRDSYKWLDDVTVELVKSNASDADVVWAAKVSTAGERSLEDVGADADKSTGLIRFLLRERHGTPFEHGSMTFFVKAPIFVFREFHRHRIGWSYNEESGRYSQLKPEFYLPAPDRALQQVGKPGHYEYVAGTPEQYESVYNSIKLSNTVSYDLYQEMLENGVAREVSRMVLPVNTFSSMYATCNPRSLMAFLSLRTKSDDSFFKSYPQREIEMVADKLESIFADLMPITHAAFSEFGRVSP